eukprot:Sspe_Gene.104137::Locus_80041_Transcript_1_1_Confidence_1.000_Length_472::g.104137::m.104137
MSRGEEMGGGGMWMLLLPTHALSRDELALQPPSIFSWCPYPPPPSLHSSDYLPHPSPPLYLFIRSLSQGLSEHSLYFPLVKGVPSPPLPSPTFYSTSLPPPNPVTPTPSIQT